MKSSLFLVASGAMLAMAGPIALDKRAMKTVWDYEVVTVTVTAGKEPEPSAAVFMEPDVPAVPTTTAAPPPPKPEAKHPKPTTTTKRVKPTTKRPAPPPKPTTTIVEQPPPPPPAPTTTTTVKPAPPPPEPTTTVVEQPAEPTTTSVPDSPGGSLGDYETTMLDQHNMHRLNHSSPKVTWDSELAEWASNSAKGCVFAHDMDQGDGGYGQNLAASGSTDDISSKQVETGAGGVTNQWYNSEVENWTFYGADNPPEDSDLNLWGHFTQVVWKGTEVIGCATELCPGGTIFDYDSWFTVCNYKGPGNFGGEYGKNVLEPLGQKMAVV